MTSVQKYIMFLWQGDCTLNFTTVGLNLISCIIIPMAIFTTESVFLPMVKVYFGQIPLIYPIYKKRFSLLNLPNNYYSHGMARASRTAFKMNGCVFKQSVQILTASSKLVFSSELSTEIQNQKFLRV